MNTIVSRAEHASNCTLKQKFTVQDLNTQKREMSSNQTEGASDKPLLSVVPVVSPRAWVVTGGVSPGARVGGIIGVPV